ncbi:MAG TPA: ABC transporter substrate-binding protein [Chloroflexota bacterium]|nr:ABC transporter substrate-binding protein [Chloroflexota bacterium]
MTSITSRGARTRAACLLAAWAISMSACGTPPSSVPSSSGPGPAAPTGTRKAITIAATASVKGMGIMGSSTGAGGWASIIEINTNGLITSDAHAHEPAGQLAASVPSIDDGSIQLLNDGRMRVTYHLRPGITWQDGAPFTAGDLVFSGKVLTDRGLPNNYAYAAKLIDAFDAPDDLTFNLTFKRPYINGAALGFTQFWPQPEHLLGDAYQRYLQTQDADEFSELPYWTTAYVHLGPFRLTSYEAGQQLDFEAYDGYFLGRPKLDVIHVRFFADENALFTNLLAGSVDIMVSQAISTQLGFQLKDRWDSSGEGTVYTVLTGTRFLVPQFRPSVQTEPANLDPRVRGALYQAIDRDSVSEREGPAWSLLPPSDHLYEATRDGFRRYPYDPDRAKAILRDLGWITGNDGVLHNVADGRVYHNAIWTTVGARDWEMAIYADYWRRIGLEVEEFKIPGAQVRNLEYRAHYPSWEASSAGSGDQVLGRLEGPAGSPENRWTGNRGGYEDARAEELVARYNTSISPRDQLEAMHALSEFVAAELPILPIYFGASHLAVRKGVHALDDVDGGADPAMPYGTYTRNAYLWDLQ